MDDMASRFVCESAAKAVGRLGHELARIAAPDELLARLEVASFSDAVARRFAESLEASALPYPDLFARVASDGLLADAAEEVMVDCAKAELWQSSGASDNASDAARASLASFAELAEVRLWYYDRDNRIMESAKDCPACWGGNYRVDEGLYATQDDVERVLDTSRSLDLYYCCCFCATYEDWYELAANQHDDAWLSRRRGDYIGGDPVVYYTEFFPTSFDEEELEAFAFERPDLFSREAVSAWPRELAGPALSAGIDLSVNGERTWVSYEPGCEGVYGISELRDRFATDPGLAEDREAGSTVESWIGDLQRTGVLSEVPSDAKADPDTERDYDSASSVAATLGEGACREGWRRAK